jgi:mannose-1-phosphate guanylyltransferase
VHRGYWIDIGTPEKYLKAHQDILSGAARLKGFERKPDGIYIDAAASVDDPSSVLGPSFIGARSTVKRGARIEPFAVVGQNCLIEEGATVADSVLWPNVRVGEHARIQGSLVGRNTHVGRYALVDRGVVLGDKSVVADYSRLSHAEG